MELFKIINIHVLVALYYSKHMALIMRFNLKQRFYDFNFLVCYHRPQYCVTGFKLSSTTIPWRGRAKFTSKYWLSKRRTWSTALKMFRQSKSTIPFSRLLEDPLCKKLIICSAVKPSAPIWLFRKCLTVGCFRESWRKIWQLCHNDYLSMPCLGFHFHNSFNTWTRTKRYAKESILQLHKWMCDLKNGWKETFTWLFIAFFPYKQEEKCYKCLIQYRKMRKPNVFF